MKVTTLLLVIAAVGCSVDDPEHITIEPGDEVDEAVTDTPLELATLDDVDVEEVATDEEPTTLASVISPAYHLYTRVGATCRDHCVANDQYLFTYYVGYSSPYYHYKNTSIYSTYWVGSSKKQKWEQHRFSTAQVNVFCGSSGQYLYKYYGLAKKGREVVRTWLCYAGSCRFLGDNYGSFYSGWRH